MPVTLRQTQKSNTSAYTSVALRLCRPLSVRQGCGAKGQFGRHSDEVIFLLKLKFCFVLGSKFIQAYQILGLLCFALCVSRNFVVVPMMEEFQVASILKTSDAVPLTW